MPTSGKNRTSCTVKWRGDDNKTEKLQGVEAAVMSAHLREVMAALVTKAQDAEDGVATVTVTVRAGSAGKLPLD